MTVYDMIREVFEHLGEPTDLEINTTPGDYTTFDITLPGSQRILTYLNNALIRIANWRYPDGVFLRFNSLYKTLFVKHPAPYTGTVVSATTTTVVVPGFPMNLNSDFDGWRVDIIGGTGAGQKRLITSSVAAGLNEVCTVHKAWDTVPDAASTFRITKNFMFLLDNTAAGSYTSYHIQLDPHVNTDSIIKIVDKSNNTVLDRTWDKDLLETGDRDIGVPSVWYRYGNKIVFDTCFKDETVFELLYYAHPLALTQANQVPNIPVPFHEAVALYAITKLKVRAGDYDGQYVEKRNLIDLMETLRLPNSMSTEADYMTIAQWG